MKPDPKRRRNGKCAGPDCDKPLPAICKVHNDPFCSSTCASAWHGVDLRFPVQHWWNAANN